MLSIIRRISGVVTSFRMTNGKRSVAMCMCESLINQGLVPSRFIDLLLCWTLRPLIMSDSDAFTLCSIIQFLLFLCFMCHGRCY